MAISALNRFVKYQSRRIRHGASPTATTNRGIFSSSSVSSSRIFHKFSIVSAYGAITGAVAMCPLDELEKTDRKNDAYHHHLHPR